MINATMTTAGGLKDTTVRVNVLLTNPFIIVRVPDCYFRLNYTVTSFQVTFIVNTDSVTTKAYGAPFSNEQIRMIKMLKPGDKIYFNDIRAVMADDEKLSPFWITIK
jgi:GldM C-terminal domain